VFALSIEGLLIPRLGVVGRRGLSFWDEMVGMTGAEVVACMGGGFCRRCSAAMLASERGWMDEMFAGASNVHGFSFSGDEASKLKGCVGLSSEVMTKEGASERDDLGRAEDGRREPRRASLSDRSRISGCWCSSSIRSIASPSSEPSSSSCCLLFPRPDVISQTPEKVKAHPAKNFMASSVVVRSKSR
jgi:hypothetical protein